MGPRLRGDESVYSDEMIQVTPTIALDDSELSESFVRASGPGGQNVNKVSSAVQLRFDVRQSRALPNDVAVRLMKLAGKRLTKDGVIVILAQQFREQERNRAAARERLFDMIRQAAVPPVPRRATRVPRSEKKRRLEGKKRRGKIKSLRQRKPSFE
jgi:ribosome-associated protein